MRAKKCSVKVKKSGGALKKVPSERPSSVRFVFKEPNANSVNLAGSFNHWDVNDIEMKKNKGQWITELSLAPGRYEYLFVVDGKWMPDQKAKSVPNAYGTINSIIDID